MILFLFFKELKKNRRRVVVKRWREFFFVGSPWLFVVGATVHSAIVLSRGPALRNITGSRSTGSILTNIV